MSQSDDTSSPYVELVNLCYQLRHEKESISTALTAKEEVARNLEGQVSILKKQLSESASLHRSELEACLSDKMSLQDERLLLTQKLYDLEERYRRLETKEIQVREQADQFEEMIRLLKAQHKPGADSSNSAHAMVEKDLRIIKLEIENKRLVTEMSTLQILYKKAVQSKATVVSESPDMSSQPSKRPREDLEVPKYTLSSSESLLREFETVIGWSIVKENDSGKIDLVCNSNQDIVIRLICRDNRIEVLLDNASDDPSSTTTFLRTFNSVPGYVAKKTLEELTKRVIRDQ